MLNQKIAPMLASAAEPFDSPDFLYEVKWDGMRCILFANEKGTRLQNRGLVDVSFRYPEITALRDYIHVENAILDGEIVILSGGKPDFYKLQRRFRLCDTRKIEWHSTRLPATYVVFDILYLNGQSCLDMPLHRRKELIKGFIEKSPSMIISHPFPGQGIKLFNEACRHELEGIVAKRGDSPYAIGKRSKDWLKIKSKHEVTCYIAGYKVKDSLWDHSVEALVLAEANGLDFSYCGHVGSGFSNAELDSIHKRLSYLRSECPCIPHAKKWKGVQWVRPELKCMIVYNERTPDGQLRAPVFKSLVD